MPSLEPKPSALVVDDNEVHRYCLSKYLLFAGFDVHTTGTATGAVSLAKKHFPSVVLLDVHLPDFSGFEACAQIKKDASTKSIPVIFHSATAIDSDAREQAMTVGAAAFMTYPLDFEQLAVVIKGSITKAVRIAKGLD